MTDNEEKPKDEAQDEPKPENEDKPDSTPVAAPAAQSTGITLPINLAALEGLFVKPLLLLGIVFGVLLRFLGAIMLNFDVNHSASAFIFNLGTMLLLITLFGGAMMNNKLDPNVRLGMLIASAFIGFNQGIYT